MFNKINDLLESICSLKIASIGDDPGFKILTLSSVFNNKFLKENIIFIAFIFYILIGIFSQKSWKSPNFTIFKTPYVLLILDQPEKFCNSTKM